MLLLIDLILFYSFERFYNILIFNHRVAVLDKVTDFLLFIGKLTITGGMGKTEFDLIERFP